MEVITKSAKDTKKLGQKVGSSLKGGEIIALSGDLGAGKTTFVQGLAVGLGIESKIISPTFILMRQHKFSDFNFYHVDLYRLEDSVKEEVINLGLTDVWGKGNNIVVVEWAEKAKSLFPKETIWINFELLNDDERKITISD